MLEMAQDGEKCAQLASSEAAEKAETARAMQQSTEGWEMAVNEEIEAARQAALAVRGACTAAQDRASEAAGLQLSMSTEVPNMPLEQLQEWRQPDSRLSLLVAQAQRFVADASEGAAAAARASCNVQQMCSTAPSYYTNQTGKLLEVSIDLNHQTAKVNHNASPGLF